MHIHIHIPDHPDKDTAERLYRIEKSLGEIVETQEIIMATLADIQSTLATVDTALGVVKTDVEILLAKIVAIPPGGLTLEQQTAIDDIAKHVQGIATSLGAIDTEVNPPAPTPTP